MIHMPRKLYYAIWLVIITACTLIALEKCVKADTGEQLLRDGQYEFYAVPEIRLIMVTDDVAWHRLVRYNFPDRPTYIGKDVKGIAIRDRLSNGLLRYTILMPLTQSSFNSYIMMETVVGHEFLHIVDYSVGKDVFDPDTWDSAERRQQK